MLPGSNFTRDLESIAVPPNKMVTLIAVYDELVPQQYSQMKGNTSYFIPVWGHNRSHLGRKETYDLIAKLAGEK